jgi:hypothetical protein
MTSHFWVKNPETKAESYCIQFNGLLEKLTLKSFDYVSINYNEILEIINTATKEEKYSKLEKIYNLHKNQKEDEKKELSKEEQVKLKDIFRTHKTL